MAFVPSMIPVSSTTVSTILTPTKSAVLQNTNGSYTIYIGDSYVSTSNYAFKLAPGEKISLSDISGYLYGIASGSGVVLSMAIFK